MALSRSATNTSTMCSALSTIVQLTNYWKCGTALSKNVFLRIFDGKSPTSRENVHDNIFIFARNKGLIRTMITTSRINLFTGTIFRHGKLLFVLWTGFAVLTLFWTNGKWNCKTFFYKVLHISYSYTNIQRIWIIRSLQTYCQLSTFNTRNVPFKTRFTSWLKRKN